MPYGGPLKANLGTAQVAVVIGLLVVVVVCCYLLFGPNRNSSFQPRMTSPETADRTNTTNESYTNLTRFNGHTPSANLSKVDASADNDQTDSNPSQVDQMKIWRIRCRVGDGPASAGIVVQAELRGAASDESTLETLVQTTDSSGVATFETPPALACLTSFLASVSTDMWFSPRRLSLGDFRSTADQGVYQADMILVPIRMVFLDVTYSDGKPFEGGVTFLQAGTTRSVLVVAGRAEFSAIPADETIAIAKTRRPGYKALFRKLTAGDIEDKGLVRLVLEQTRGPMSGLVVTAPSPLIEGVPIDVSFAVTFTDAGRNVMSGRMPYTPDIGLRYDNYQLMPGRYEVTARKGDYVAYAEALLPPDEVAEVALEWTAAASVRATVIGPDGRPVQGAVLRYPAGPYVTFPARSTRNGLWAITNKDGMAVLRGIAAREQTLLVEAEGCEVYEIHVSPIQQATVDVRCEMKPATGKIVVELANAVNDGKYLVSYQRPSSGDRDQNIVIRAGESLVIDGLPRRLYTVWAKGGENGPIAAELADLSLTENGKMHVVLDVRHLASR